MIIFCLILSLVSAVLGGIADSERQKISFTILWATFLIVAKLQELIDKK